MDGDAEELPKKNQWDLELYNKLLQTPNNSQQQNLSYSQYRPECLFHGDYHETVINDSKQTLKSLNGKYDHTTEPRIRIQLLRSLFAVDKVAEVEMVVKDWLISIQQLSEFGEMKIGLEKALERFFTLNSRESFNVWLSSLEQQFGQSYVLNRGDTANQVFCIYCNLFCKDKIGLLSHCATQEHEAMIMSDEGRDWHWRAPPRGIKSDAYQLCENWKELGACRSGIQCIDAHGEAEILEWKERFKYRQMKLLRAKEKKLYGKSYTESLLERWIQASNNKSIMNEVIENVEDCCSNLSVTVSSKNSKHEWIFNIKTQLSLRAVALLEDTYRNHFHISKINTQDQQFDINNNQEFITNNSLRQTPIFEYSIGVEFQTTIFGTFRQSVIFDFGFEPVLVKHLCADVVPDSDIEKINEIRKEITCTIEERWTVGNSRIIPFESNLNTTSDWEKKLKELYPCQQFENLILSHATVSEKKFTSNNYRERMHELLFVEEIARYNLISQYNLTTKLQLAHSYRLSPNSMAASTTKYATDGELFASVCLSKELSEDTAEGRLILMHCNSVYLSLHKLSLKGVRTVHEAIIEDKGKDIIYLRLSSQTVKDLFLTPEVEPEVQIQFHLNRIPYCEWHYTIDRIRNYKLIFPDVYVDPIIPWSPSRQWSIALDSRLNLKQKEAIVAITTPTLIKLPPILVIGPFGTGKTFTLAQAIKELIKDGKSKILLCTHSNSAADLYIKDYFHIWVTEGMENATPLRVYYQKRWVATVSPVVQKYCNITSNGLTREFQLPTFSDIEQHQIVVVTLSTSVYLSAMGLPPGTFTHILLDEAAQALECETITPLALATDTTRIVLAGDHMQLGPDIFSKFSKQRNLHISLLERLYDLYPNQFSCKILLCENYRAHTSIVQFTSDSFYDQKLVSSSKQPKHAKFYPLSFFTTRGEDMQDKNSTAFYNNAEVYEVVERVAELRRNWPSDWGDINEQSIGVVTPYSDQVFRIRSELRKKKIDVCVERVLNVQGKQFRAIFLSTVRTRRTCKNNNENNVDYGFLSNSKLLNTAITRAQSLVAVVGDPIALCSLGRCSKVWERFIQICNEHGSLFGITWSQLKFQLDGIELKKIYTLNPLAPEFIPRGYKDVQVNLNQPKLLVPLSNVRVVPLIHQQRPPLHLPPFVVSIPTANSCKRVRLHNPQEMPIVVPPRVPMCSMVPVQQLQRTPSTNNNLIQFLNNVHFPPEAHILNECVSLLPHNMSLADMILQSSQVQEQWYQYLRKSSGQEAAEKFKYLLHTTKQKGSKVPDGTIFGRSTPISSSDSPTFNWFDSPSNQINMNKPIYMKDDCPDLSRSNPLYKRQRNMSSRPDDEISRQETETHRLMNDEFAQLNLNGSSDDWYHVLETANVENFSFNSLTHSSKTADASSI